MPRAHRDDDTGHGGQAKEHQRDRQDRAGARRTRPGESTGANPVLVGSANAIGVVVRVVHGDLKQHGDREARECTEPVPPDATVITRDHVRGRGTEGDRRDGQRQGLGARRANPVAEGGLLDDRRSGRATARPAAAGLLRR